MSDKNKIEPAVERIKEELAAQVVTGSCGALLATARRSKGLSVQDVATRLCLSGSQIEALETDNYALLPEETFTRGYIKSFARLVDLDSDLVLSFYPTSGDNSIVPPKMVMDQAEPMLNAGSGWPKLLIILASIAMLAVVAWLVLRQPSEEINSAPTLESTQNTSSDAIDGAAPSGGGLQFGAQSSDNTSNDISNNTYNNTYNNTSNNFTSTTANTTINSSVETGGDSENVQPAINDVPVANSLPGGATSPAGVFTSPAASPEDDAFKFGASNLTVNCLSAVWVDIRDNNGEKIFYRTCKGGEFLTFGIDLPATVFVGSIVGVELTLDDQAVDLLSYSNGLSYARFTLDARPGTGSQSTESPAPQVQ